MSDRLFFIEYPNCEVADPKNAEYGEAIVENRGIAASMSSILQDLRDAANYQDINISYFRNWGETQAILVFYAQPVERDEVKQLVNAARKMQLKVGVGGGYHSWSPVFPDQGNLFINTYKLKLPTQDGEEEGPYYRRIRFSSTNSQDNVTIAPGVTGGELMKFFLEHNVCITSDVVLPTVTYGGVVAGGCHGTGKDEPSVSDKVTAITVVKSDGNEKNISDEETLKAARVNLATFGVMVEIKMAVVTMLNVEVETTFPLVGESFTTTYIKNLYDNNWSLELFWYPYNSIPLRSMLPRKGEVFTQNWNPDEDELAIRKINESAQTSTVKPSPPPKNVFSMDALGSTLSDIDQEMKAPSTETSEAQTSMMISDAIKNILSVIGLFGLNALTPLLNQHPEYVPIMLKLVLFSQKLVWSQSVTVAMPYAIHYQDGIPLNPLYCMEFAFAYDPSQGEAGFADLVGAMNDLKHLLQEDQQQGKYPVSMVMEVRLMGRSDSLLCPAAAVVKDSPTKRAGYVEILSLLNTPGYVDFYRRVALAWMDRGGVPHWNKQWKLLESEGIDINGYIRRKYDDNIESFLRLRTLSGVDTDDMFMNTAMKKIFYPVPV